MQSAKKLCIKMKNVREKNQEKMEKRYFYTEKSWHVNCNNNKYNKKRKERADF